VPVPRCLLQLTYYSFRCFSLSRHQTLTSFSITQTVLASMPTMKIVVPAAASPSLSQMHRIITLAEIPSPWLPYTRNPIFYFEELWIQPRQGIGQIFYLWWDSMDLVHSVKRALRRPLRGRDQAGSFKWFRMQRMGFIIRWETKFL